MLMILNLGSLQLLVNKINDVNYVMTLVTMSV